MANEIQLKKSVGDKVIARVNSLCEAGFTMPKDYNYVNAVKMSLLKIQDLKDKNGSPALDVCTPGSIQSALFQMCCKGLNAALNQIYFVVRGNVLCAQESYFGKVLMVKRIYPNWNPNPVVIREGDVFEFAIDPTTGKRRVIKHEQTLENMDKGFVGGYLYLPTGDLYVMTKKQIMAAWAKSSSREQATHKAFDEKMVGKTLVNSGCNMIINSTPEYQTIMDEGTNATEQEFHNDTVDEQSYIRQEEFEEVEDKVVVEPVQEEPQEVEAKEVSEQVRKKAMEGGNPSDFEPNGEFDF